MTFLYQTLTVGLTLSILGFLGVENSFATRADRANATISELKRTPVSALDFGIKKLNDDINSSLYFRSIKMDMEAVVVSARIGFIVEPEPMTTIQISGILVAAPGSTQRTRSQAEVDCVSMLNELATIPSIYLDEENRYFLRLWHDELDPNAYEQITYQDIQETVYLKASLSSRNSDDQLHCGRLYNQ
jgi:hypothetical protein